MPYEWLPPATAPEAPKAELHLWPYRSLPRKGFVMFIAGTALALLVPLIAVIGSPILWGLLPFVLGVLAALWWALSRSYRDGEELEELRIWSERIELVRHRPLAAALSWEANPYWVKVTLHETGGPVPQYLTLSGGGREVEIGAFLSEDERVRLAREIRQRLAGPR